MPDRIKVWGDPSAYENPFQQLFFSLLRLPRGEGVEPPERVVTGLKEGPLHLWRLSGMDGCPTCGNVREAYSLQGTASPVAAWCRSCQSLEVRDADGALLYGHSFEEESKSVMEMLAECEPPETADDGEEE